MQVNDRANSSVDIFPTTFHCDGTENTLIECSNGIATGGLSHSTDAHVTCQRGGLVRG